MPHDEIRRHQILLQRIKTIRLAVSPAFLCFTPPRKSPPARPRAMPPPFLALALAVLLAGPALSGARHVITVGAGDSLRPTALAWDPTAQHFLVGSRLRPAVSAVSDAGVVETLVSADHGDPLLFPHNSSVAAIAVDNPRRRLLAAFTNPPAVAAFDLRSPRPHRRLFAAALPAAPGGLVVDLSSGRAFVTAGDQILKLDLDGNPTSFSRSPIYEAEEGLGGAAHVSLGFLLVAQGSTGKLFKVDDETGAARDVLLAGGDRQMSAAEVALTGDGTVVVAGDRLVRRLKSRDGWAEAVVKDESSPPVAAEAGGVIRGLAMRDWKEAYVLISTEEEEGEDGGTLGEKSRIEEVQWEKDGEGDMVWIMVLVGLGLAYLSYWRFQMRQLASNMNKKRA